MKPTAFHIPTRSVMASAKPHKLVNRHPEQYVRVVGRAQSQIDNDRRHAMRKASI